MNKNRHFIHKGSFNYTIKKILAHLLLHSFKATETCYYICYGCVKFPGMLFTVLLVCTIMLMIRNGFDRILRVKREVWMQVLSICLMVIITLCAISYGLYVFLIKKLYKTLKDILFFGFFIIVTLLYAVGLLFYYPYNTLSYLAIMNTIFLSYLGFILAYHFRSTKSQRIIFYIFTGLFMFFTIWKFVSFDELTFIQRMPLNVCNILIIFMVICSIKRVNFLEQYIVCFALLAGLINLLLGGFYDDTPSGIAIHALRPEQAEWGYFNERFLEAALLHGMFLTMGIYSIMRKYVKVDVKKSMINLLWIVPLFFVFVFMNQVWDTDFFFTYTNGATPGFLISIYHIWPLQFTIGGFEVNILHSLFIITLSSLVLFLLSLLLQTVQRKFVNDSPALTNESVSME